MLNDEDGWIPALDEEDLGDPQTAAAGADSASGPAFRDLESWVRDYLALHIRRRLGGSATWCPKWWAHAEAISRLTALWMAWEHLRTQDALGMSQWWIYHADPHLAVLLSKDAGPFASCRTDRHVELDPLPCEAAPPGLWASGAFG